MIELQLEGLDRLTWKDMFPRQFVSGECEGWCAETFMVLISRPFTADEDAGFKWLNAQDVVDLVGIMPLPDGRDLMLFDRCFVLQSRAEAKWEQERHMQVAFQRVGVRLDIFGL